MKKKGFTLIELIAVIILLGVVALISTPIIMSVIDSSKEEARKNSVLGYADAVKLSYAEQQFEENKEFTLEELANKKMQGNKVTCEIVTYTESYGALLTGCTVEDNDDKQYCYFSGNVYNDATDNPSEECSNIKDVINNNGEVEYKTPIITAGATTPENTEWYQARAIKIEYPSLAGITQKTYIRANKNIDLQGVIASCGDLTTPSECETSNVTTLTAGTWYQVNGDVNFTIYENLTIYAIIGNNDKFGHSADYTETKIDATAPENKEPTITVTSDQAVVKANCSDAQSGISRYYFKINDGSYNITTTDSYLFSGLTEGNEYTFTVKCANGSGIVSSEVSNKETVLELDQPEIVQASQVPNKSTTYPTYAQERTINIKYQTVAAGGLSYYFKSDAQGTVDSSKIKEQCEYTNGVMINCKTVSDVTILIPNVWYKITDSEINITYKNSANIVAIVSDGINYKGSGTYLVTNIDTSKPTASITSITTKSDRATITANCTDTQSGITLYQFSKDGGSTWDSNGTTKTKTYTNLTSGKDYTFAVKCTDGAANVSDTKTQIGTPTKITAPTIAQVSQVPTDTTTYPTYAQQRVIRITFYGTGIQNPKYYYSEDGKTWTQVTTTTKDFTYTTTGYLYAKTEDDSGNVAQAATYTIANIDTTNPSASIISINSKSDRAVISASCSDSESGIVKYEYSKDGGSTWENGTGNSHTFTNLVQGTEYDYVVKCTNGAALTASANETDETEVIAAPTIEQYSQVPTKSDIYPTYAQQRVIRITFYGTGIQNPKYYYSTDNKTWTQVTTTTKDFTYTTTGYLYAKTVDDAGNVAQAATYTIANIDTTAPTVEIVSVSSKTDRSVITASCTDTSGIVKYEYSKDGGSTWVTGSGSSHTFTNLTQDTEYTYALRCTNGAAIPGTDTDGDWTEVIPTPEISQTSQVPEKSTTYPTYAQSRTIKITYSNTNVANAKYYYSYDGKTWTQVTSTTYEETFTKAGYLYAKTEDDAGNVAQAATYTIANIDNTKPIAIIESVSAKTDRATITATCSDTQSGVTKYYFSKDGGSTYPYSVSSTATSYAYTISGLTSGSTYTFTAKCEDGAANVSDPGPYDKTIPSITAPTIVQQSQTPEGSTYAQSRTLRITYTGTSIQSPEYYFKSTVDSSSTNSASVVTGTITHVCGSGTMPGSCTATPTTSITAGYWYKTSSTTVDLTFRESGTLYAVTKDAKGQYKGSQTFTVTNFDEDAPTASLTITSRKTDRITVKATCADAESGITKYQFLKDGTTVATYSSTATTYSYTYANLDDDTDYNVAVICTNGANLTTTATLNDGTVAFTKPTITQVSQVPTKSTTYPTYAQERVIRITYSGTNVQNPKYYYSTDNSTWTQVTTTTKDFTYTSTGYLYAKVVDDAGNIAQAATYTIANIDNTKPVATIESVSTKTDRAVIKASCTDTQSGITKYEFSKDGGSTYPYSYSVTLTNYGDVNLDGVVDTNDSTMIKKYLTGSITLTDQQKTNADVNLDGKISTSDAVRIEEYLDGTDSSLTSYTYTFTNLTAGSSYTFAVRCTDGAANVSDPAKSSKTIPTITAPTIVQQSQTPEDGTYAQSRTLRIKYTGTNIESPEYYFKSTVDSSSINSASVVTGTITHICGNGTMPGSCTTTSTTDITAGYWYKTSSTTVDLTFYESGTLYAVTKDANGQYKGSQTYTVTNFDEDGPTASLSVTSRKTDRITVKATCADAESGITKYQFLKDGTTVATYSSTATTYSYTYSNLDDDTDYNVAVICTNGANLTSTATLNDETGSFTKPTITQVSQVPTQSTTYPTYAQSRTIRITYSGANVQNPKYYYSTDNSTWTQVTTTTKDFTYTTTGYLYAKVVDDAGNIAQAATYTIANIDTTKPTAGISVSTKTDRATITASCTDTQSGITKYEYSKDNGSTWVSNGTTKTYTFSSLTPGGTYTFAVRCTDGAANVSDKVTSSKQLPSVTTPTITEYATYGSGTTWKTGRTFKITYSSSNITSPTYYFKTTVTTTASSSNPTVSSGVVVASCGTGTTPGTCTTSSVTTLTPNTWYKTTSTTPLVSFTSNGYLYAATKDANGNISTTASYTVANIDTTEPTASITIPNTYTDRITVKATCTDSESGITKYHFLKDGTTVATYSSTATTYNHTYTELTSGTSYTFAVICTNGSGLTDTAQSSDSSEKITTPTISQVSQVPTDTTTYPTYAQSRTIRITYSSANIVNPKYYYSEDGKTWTQVTTTTKDFTYTTTGYLYAKTVDDAGNIAQAATYTIANMDTTKPTAGISVSTKTDRATITASCTETQSGITLYQYSKDGGSTWVSNGTTKTYTFGSLTPGGTYTFAVRCTDGAANVSDKVTSSKQLPSVTTPTIAEYSTSGDGTTWKTGRTFKITYSSSNITSPTYYFKTTVTATASSSNPTVSSGVVVASCGTGTTPGTCTTSSVTTLTPNTWYKTTSTTPLVSFTSNGYLYAATKDGNGNVSTTASYTVANIDAESPTIKLGTVTATTKSLSIPFTISNNLSGVYSYDCRATYGSATYNGTVSGNTCTITGLSSGTTYTVSLTVTANNKLATNYSTSATTVKMVDPAIAAYSTFGDGTTWKTGRMFKITYTGTGLSSPTYYFKTTVSATATSSNPTVNTGIVTASCGTGTTPGTCTTTSVTSLTPNTWYKTTSTSVIVSFTSNGYLYALTKDSNGAISNTKSYTVTNIDHEYPTISASVGAISSASSANISNAKLTYTLTDTGGSGIKEYGIPDLFIKTGSGNSISGTYSSFTSTGYYSFYVTDNAGRTTWKDIYVSAK